MKVMIRQAKGVTAPFYTIVKVTEQTSLIATTFISKMRKELFPMLKQTSDQNFFNMKETALFVAQTKDGEVIGSIGVVKYDHRFNYLLPHYNKFKTAEIVKCYIDQKYRRCGIGSALFERAVQFAKSVNYECLYLHSHPFLPGGIPFWHAKGFENVYIEEDPVWHTHHMNLYL